MSDVLAQLPEGGLYALPLGVGDVVGVGCGRGVGQRVHKAPGQQQHRQQGQKQFPARALGWCGHWWPPSGRSSFQQMKAAARPEGMPSKQPEPLNLSGLRG